MVGNGLTDGQWWSRNFYDLLVSMCCKFLNLNDMTNKKVFVTGKMTLTVSRTQTLSFLDKSCAVRSCIHQCHLSSMPSNSPLGYWKWILSYTKMFLIILAVRWDNSLCYSYCTFEDALHSTDVVIEASLAKRCYAENSLGLFSFTRCHLAFSHADSPFNSASGYVKS